MIVGEIRRYLRDNNTVRVSRSVRDLAYKALSARDEIAKKTVSEPTVEQIAAYLNESAESISCALEAIAEPVSIFDPVYSDGDDAMCVMDRISDENCNDGKWIESIALSEALKGLNKREKAIIDMRFFNGKTQMEAASEIGISQAQVSRIEKSALEKLKKQM
ncbi:MAG: sigma-70 family RNA polymerase sigma factor [Clostridia bacterium]|nr:sigma-70 family RNA polymerase sigma factor [Clostridia bacterium]